MSKSVLCIGATLVDELFFCSNAVVPASSNPAQKMTSIGGVVSNIVNHLALLKVKVSLITAIGNDSEADYILANFTQKGIDITGSVRVEAPTGKYVSIHQPDGNLYVAVCQDVCSQHITTTFLEGKSDYIQQFDLIVIDTNLEKQTIQWLITFAKTYHKKLIIDPVSVSKAAKLSTLNLEGVFMITPNEEELSVVAACSTSDETMSLTTLFQKGVSNIWIRKGNRGSVLCSQDNSIHLSAPVITIIDSTGAGDAALAGWIFGHINEVNELTALQLGHSLAFEVLKIKGAVAENINCDQLLQLKKIYYE